MYPTQNSVYFRVCNRFTGSYVLQGIFKSTSVVILGEIDETYC